MQRGYRGPNYVPCPVCEKTFYLAPCRVRAHATHTCSFACRNVLAKNRKRPIVLCERCGKEIKVAPSRVGHTRFCQRICPGPEVHWSKDLAYLTGLIASDGYLSKDTQRISLSSNDDELIQFAAKRLPLPRIHVHKTTSNISLYSTWPNLYNFLLSIGITPRKSLTIGRLAIPDEFFFDFMRGEIDGDGYVGYHKGKFPEIRIYSGSKVYLDWIAETLLRLKGIRSSFYQRKATCAHCLNVYGKEAVRLGCLIWNGEFSLNRKKYFGKGDAWT
jgi:hypothetical protein